MINYNPKSWFKLIFALHKSDTIRILWKEIIYIGLFTGLISFFILTYFPNSAVLNQLISVYSLIGFVISLLLVFRTNTAYDRWWEGRKIWGSMVNNTRNLASKLSSLNLSPEDIDLFRRMITNFVFASKEHLRKGVLFNELDLTDEEISYLSPKKHVPLAMTQLMYKRLNELLRERKITDQTYRVLDTNLNAFMDILGACERIKKTPIPYSYSLFLKKFIFVYVTTLPLAFINSFGYFSVLIASYVFYVLVSMEVLAEEIEDPFGTDDNDLPTDQLSEKIQEDVNEIFQKINF
jgi:putative membrane protein